MPDSGPMSCPIPGQDAQSAPQKCKQTFDTRSGGLAGGRRGIGTNEERDQTLNQLLTELDGFEGRPGVLLLAATNRPEVMPLI